MSSRLVIVGVVGLWGCGNGSGSGSVAVDLVSRCQPATALNFAATQVGQSSFAIVEVSSNDDVTNVAITIDGPDSGEFAFASTCGESVANNFCVVTAQVTPMSTGDKQATLHIGDQEVVLAAIAIDPSSGLFSTVANLALVSGPTTSGGATFALENLGASPVTLQTPGSVEADDLLIDVGFSDCPQPLTTGGVCTVAISVFQLDTGCASGTAHVATSAGNLDLPIASEFIAIAQASVASTFGGGHGHITSDVGGIDCSGMEGSPKCAGKVDGETITFTATPESDSVFNGWLDPRCNRSTTCSYHVGPLDTAPNAVADFVPAASKAIQVTFTGDGTGVVHGDGLCTSSCTMYVPEGNDFGLTAVANSQFGGWSEACTGTMPFCDLGMIVNDRNVTVNFTKDAHEATSTRMPVPSSATAAAYVPGGDLIIVASTGAPLLGTAVTRASPDGTNVWTKFITGFVQEAAVTSTGDVYVLTNNAPTTLTKLSVDGVLQWQVEIGQSPATAVAIQDDDAIVGTSSGIEAHAAVDGSVVWMQPLTQPADDIAVGPAGVIAATVGTEIDRFAKDGTPVTGVLSLPGAGRAKVAYDAAGDLIALGDGVIEIGGVVTPAKLTKFTAAGAQSYSVDLDTAETTAGGQLVIASDGTVATLRIHQPVYSLPVGGFVETYDASGARLWQVDKQGARTGPGEAVTGFVGGTLIAPSTGGIQLLGSRNDTDGVPVLETFTP